MLYKINDKGLLLRDGESVEFMRSPNFTPRAHSGRYAVIHFTAGRSAEKSAKGLCDPKRQAGAHLVIARSGRVIQLTDITLQSWHAGDSEYGGHRSINKHGPGIELENYGEVTPAATAPGQYRTWFGVLCPGNQVIRAAHPLERPWLDNRFWQTYPDKQIEALIEVLRAIRERWPAIELIGHEDCAMPRGRKTDPGPAFPWHKVRDALAQKRQGSTEV